MAAPKFVRPMLATLSRLPEPDHAYGFEFKWDGVRAVLVAADRATLYSRNGRDITRRYPELRPLLDRLADEPGGIVLDGEVIAVNPAGRPDFGLLQRRMHLDRAAQIEQARREAPVAYVLFDLLWHGRSLIELPYNQRRRRLEQLALAGPAWQTPPMRPAAGETMTDSARALGLEGVVAKRLDSLYRPGARSPDWLKVKVIQGQEFVIGGWVPERGTRLDRVGSLLLGYYDATGGRLRFAGGVGTGFDAADHAQLTALLSRLRRPDSPFADPVPRKGALFVEPSLVADVEFYEWTTGGVLRHPRYKGLRDDKPPRHVVRERAA